VVSPVLIEVEAGCVVMAAGCRIVTVAVFEFAPVVFAELVTFTQ
jgi:hypothetical protein